MIEFIRGTLVSKLPHRLVIEHNGVGIEVLIPLSTWRDLGDSGTDIRLLCHLHWREEGPQLFGFMREEERSLFRLLCRVNKIGPKLALNILSAAPPEKIAEMIIGEDIRGLTALKGIGQKLASRLVVELKELIGQLGLGAAATEAAVAAADLKKIPFEKDAREALENLGYTGREIEKALRDSAADLPPTADLQQVIETVLRTFSR
ncbi:MAG: Holliday junction branch migration protein RuvA [Candidatus Riflebacteria bacterium]|nr:Holliday junction branch migration protein RuvA [Candidatus Riflebacteria bacterium]